MAEKRYRRTARRPSAKGNMANDVDGHGTADKHADANHVQMNRHHGMPAGLSPAGEYGDGDEGMTHGLEGGNTDFCDG